MLFSLTRNAEMIIFSTRSVYLLKDQKWCIKTHAHCFLVFEELENEDHLKGMHNEITIFNMNISKYLQMSSTPACLYVLWYDSKTRHWLIFNI